MTYPPSPPAQPPSPQRDANTTWIVLGSILIGVLLLCGGCLGVAGLGLMADTADDPDVEDASSFSPTVSASAGSSASASAGSTAATQDEPEHRTERYWDTPREIREGKAFEHDGFHLHAGWRLDREPFGLPTITGLRVTTLRGDQRTALLDFTFYRGKEVLAEVTCSSQEMQEGESSAMDCFSIDDFPEGYDSVKVSDTW